MNNIEFAEKCKSIAQNYKTVYVLGGFGAPMTEAYKKRIVEQYSYNNRPSTWAASVDTFAFDCVGLIKGVLWGWDGDLAATYGGAKYASNGVPDIGANTMITKCSGVTTDFSSISVGEVVWMDGHIGVYIGDGLAVEASPAWENKVQITAVGNIGRKTGYNARIWTNHGKLPYITYGSNSEQKQPENTDVQLKGIDVSKWNGNIDWNKVKAAGIKFAMIRLGYGSTDGNSCGMDSYFETNVRNAVAAGVNIGCYFYSYAMSAAAAKKEAQYVISVLSKYKGVFSYPVAFDLEDSTQTGLGKTVLTNMVSAFTGEIKKAGFYPMLYTNLNWLRNYINVSALGNLDIWLAQWSAAPTYTGDFGMWQNSATGKVNGIAGDVDTDFAYKDYPKIIKTGGYNGIDGWGDAGDKIHDGIQDAIDHIVDAATGKVGAKGSGDIDGDGKVTASDARKALRAAVGLDKLSAAQKAAADVNEDGKVTAADARDILRKSTGLED